MPKKRIIKSDDDTVLWQRVITEVKPLKSNIELAEFAAIFAQSDHLAPPVAKLSGRMQTGNKNHAIEKRLEVHLEKDLQNI